MSLLKDQALNGDLSAFGISEREFEMVTADQVWTGDKRPSVRRILECMIFGTMEIQALPRFQPPAEYVAAVINSFVSGCNVMTACRWVEGGARSEELAFSPEVPPAVVTAPQLFAMVCLIRGGDAGIRESFEKQVGYALSKSAEAA